MIGIYKITNNINHHCYIGQSVHISTRWKDEKIAAFNPADHSYEYPLSRAIRKYGIQNFSFEVLEECNTSELNEREHYWIQQLHPEYNQTHGGDYQAHGKLTISEVQEIQSILINDTQGQVNHRQLAIQYNVSPDTIQAINAGRAWVNSSLTYPLHMSKYDPRKPTQQLYCIDCGKPITRGSMRCNACEQQRRHIQRIKKPTAISREELKYRIRNESFTSIAKDYNVTDNAIRKWCIKHSLPKTKKEINAYSDEEWEQI